jgi:hypothetical protein
MKELESSPWWDDFVTEENSRLKGRCRICETPIRVKDKTCSEECAKKLEYENLKKERFDYALGRVRNKGNIVFENITKHKNISFFDVRRFEDFVYLQACSLYEGATKERHYASHPFIDQECKIFMATLYDFYNYALQQTKHKRTLNKLKASYSWEWEYRAKSDCKYFLSWMFKKFLHYILNGNKNRFGMNPMILEPVFNDCKNYFSVSDKSDFTRGCPSVYFRGKVPEGCKITGMLYEFEKTSRVEYNPGDEFIFHCYKCPDSSSPGGWIDYEEDKKYETPCDFDLYGNLVAEGYHMLRPHHSTCVHLPLHLFHSTCDGESLTEGWEEAAEKLLVKNKRFD